MGASTEPAPYVHTKGELLHDFVMHMTRGPIIMAALSYAVFPAYIAASQWAKHTFGLSDAALFCLWGNVIHASLYWGMSGAFHLADKQGWLDAYRMPRNPDMKNPPSLLMDTWKEAVVQQVAMVVFAYLAFVEAGGYENFFPPGIFGELPPFLHLCFYFAVAKFFNQFGFYWAHRTFHHPMFYARFHKHHHKWIGTTAFASEFAHPLEQILANLIPTLGGGLLCRTHPIVVLMYLAARLEQTYECHSGFAFHDTWLYRMGLTGSDCNAFHDFHHTVNKGNYSELWVDGLFGTISAWERQGGVEGYLAQARQQKKKAA